MLRDKRGERINLEGMTTTSFKKTQMSLEFPGRLVVKDLLLLLLGRVFDLWPGNFCMLPPPKKYPTQMSSYEEVYFIIIIIIIIIVYLLRFYFFRAVLGSQQNWQEGTDVSHILPALPHIPSLPYCQHPPPEWCIGYNQCIYIDTLPKSIVYIVLHCWCCIFYGFGQMYNDLYLLSQY